MEKFVYTLEFNEHKCDFRVAYSGYLDENSMPENGVFVFGSNTDGIHGGGAARIAQQKFGAVTGEASGMQGRSYAIITKDLNKPPHKPSVSRDYIIKQIEELYAFADNNKGTSFYIAYGGPAKLLCNYQLQDIGEMFYKASDKYNGYIPKNIIFKVDLLECISRCARSQLN